jgi:hypothetical protein
MKIEKIIFWTVIISIIGLAFWMLSGSPTDSNAIIALCIFTATSELLIWKSLFTFDKKTAIGFEKIKNNLNKINTKLENIENKLK